MVLSGALKEFILGDVFNLLSQQRITGRLVLNNGRLEGGIVFKDGIIVGADCGDDKLTNKLFNYLTGIKRIPPEQLSPVFNAQAGNMSALASLLVERSLLSSGELKSFAEACVEDMCCSLLAWDRGTYRFNDLRSVAEIACGAVTIPAENIIMEGMRRADEWSRMREYITDDMIFVASKRTETPVEFDLVNAPEEYIISLLDGSCTVKNIKASCCLCEYRVFESINALLQSQRISALEQKYTQSIQAALKRKAAEEAAAQNRTFLGSLASIGVAAAFALFFLYCRTILIPGIFGDSGGGDAPITDAVIAEQMLERIIDARQP